MADASVEATPQHSTGLPEPQQRDKPSHPFAATPAQHTRELLGVRSTARRRPAGCLVCQTLSGFRMASPLNEPKVKYRSLIDHRT